MFAYDHVMAKLMSVVIRAQNKTPQLNSTFIRLTIITGHCSAIFLLLLKNLTNRICVYVIQVLWFFFV